MGEALWHFFLQKKKMPNFSNRDNLWIRGRQTFFIIIQIFQHYYYFCPIYIGIKRYVNMSETYRIINIFRRYKPMICIIFQYGWEPVLIHQILMRVSYSHFSYYRITRLTKQQYNIPELSMTKPPSGGPRKAARPRIQVRAPNPEVNCSKPRRSTCKTRTINSVPLKRLCN